MNADLERLYQAWMRQRINQKCWEEDQIKEADDAILGLDFTNPRSLEEARGFRKSLEAHRMYLQGELGAKNEFGKRMSSLPSRKMRTEALKAQVEYVAALIQYLTNYIKSATDEADITN